MLVRRSNGLKGSYQTYRRNQVKGIIQKIPEERRQALLEMVKARAALLGVSNQGALKSAIRYLGGKGEPI